MEPTDARPPTKVNRQGPRPPGPWRIDEIRERPAARPPSSLSGCWVRPRHCFPVLCMRWPNVLPYVALSGWLPPHPVPEDGG